LAGTNVLISTTSIAGTAYQLQRRSSFTAGGWINVPGAATNALGGPLTLIDPGGISQTQAFYRLSITP
jgi:hypothetical protein